MNPLRPLRNDDADAEEARVDLAPLIDVVFLLLIFYVVTATFSQATAVPIDYPQAGQSERLPERPVVITIDASGAAWVGDDLWHQEDLHLLQTRLAQRPGRRVVVHADARAAAGDLVAVIDRCRAAGAASVDLAAQRSGAP